MAHEDQFDAAGRAVSVLGNDDLGHILFDGVLFVLVGAVDEHYYIGILLDGA